MAAQFTGALLVRSQSDYVVIGPQEKVASQLRVLQQSELRVLIERTTKNLHRVRIALQILTRRLPTTTTINCLPLLINLSYQLNDFYADRVPLLLAVLPALLGSTAEHNLKARPNAIEVAMAKSIISPEACSTI